MLLIEVINLANLIRKIVDGIVSGKPIVSVIIASLWEFRNNNLFGYLETVE